MRKPSPNDYKDTPLCYEHYVKINKRFSAEMNDGKICLGECCRDEMICIWQWTNTVWLETMSVLIPYKKGIKHLDEEQMKKFIDLRYNGTMELMKLFLKQRSALLNTNNTKSLYGDLFLFINEEVNN